MKQHKNKQSKNGQEKQHKNKSRKQYDKTNGSDGEKNLPIGVLLLLILFGSALFVLFCVGTGVMIDAIVAFSTNSVKPGEEANYLLRIVPVGLVHIFFFIAFCMDKIPFVKKSKNESFREDIAGMFFIVMAIASVVLIAVGGNYDRVIDVVIAFSIYPVIGILITPKRVKKLLRKLKEWEDTPDNLMKQKDYGDFYRIQGPVAFERRLYLEVLKYRFLNVLAVVVGVLLIILIFIGGLSNDFLASSRMGGQGIFVALIELVCIAIFGIPTIVCFLVNTICYLKMVKKHKYRACHVVVKSISDKKVSIDYAGTIYRYEYPVCVGMRKKEVQDVKATVIFLPDMIMVFPDKIIE